MAHLKDRADVPPSGNGTCAHPPAAADLTARFAAAGGIGHSADCCPRCSATLDAVLEAVNALAPHLATIGALAERVRTGGLTALLRGK